MLKDATLEALIGTARADAAKAFYHNVLGLTLESEDQFSIVFAMNGAKVRLSKVPSVVPSAYAVLGFRVADIEASLAALVKAGARMERFPFLAQDEAGIWQAPNGARVAWFRDPDLNLLSIMQPD